MLTNDTKYYMDEEGIIVERIWSSDKFYDGSTLIRYRKLTEDEDAFTRGPNDTFVMPLAMFEQRFVPAKRKSTWEYLPRKTDAKKNDAYLDSMKKEFNSYMYGDVDTNTDSVLYVFNGTTNIELEDDKANQSESKIDPVEGLDAFKK